MTTREVLRGDDRRFFTGMALASLAVVFLGFATTYYLWPITRATHTLSGRPISPSFPLIVHLHAAGFTVWMLLFLAQTSLVAVGRIDIHRRVGVAAGALVPFLVVMGLMTAIHGARGGWNPGRPFVDALSFMVVPVGDIFVFVPLVTAGLVFRRRAELHKRLMLFATVGALLPPATARLPLIAGWPVGLLVFTALVLAPAVRDFRCRARLPWVSLLVGLGILASIPVRTLVGMSAPWRAVAAWVVSMSDSEVGVREAAGSGGLMARLISFLISLSLMSSSAFSAGQKTSPRPPVIDMHTHITADKGPAIMEALNVRYWFIASNDWRDWAKLSGMAHRYLPGFRFPCPGGRSVINGSPCFDTATNFPDIAWLRGEVQAGRIRAFGEMLPQYLGIAPADSRMEPYWALAEEFDIPAAIHMGPGPPAAAYESSPAPMKNPEFRMAYGDPMLLEEVLLRHERLRLSVMHAGWPRLESMIALLYAHPHVYVDTGGLQSDRILPRAAYYRYLQALVESGFGKRIMFGSDFPDQIEMGIDAIVRADFLSAEQKADILCHNAARFLRLDAGICELR